MNKLLLACSVSIAMASISTGEPFPEDWSQARSRVAWFHAYNLPTLLTLSADGRPLMKKHAFGSLFGPMRFPPGSFVISVFSSRDRAEIFEGRFDFPDGSETLLISHGMPETGMQIDAIRRSEVETGAAIAELRIIAPPSGTIIHLEYPDENGGTVNKEFSETGKLRLSLAGREGQLVVKARAMSGPKSIASTSISFDPENPEGRVLILHGNPETLEGFVFTKLSLKTFSFALDHERASPDAID